MQKHFPINWITTIFFTIFHLGVVASLFFITWSNIKLALLTWYIVSSFGIGIGFHRLLVHRGFKTYIFFEYLLSIIGCLSLEGDPLFWCSTHRIHHRFTEQNKLDPHTPRDGKWWSHMGWMIRPNPIYYDKLTIKKWVPDLLAQPFYRWLKKLFWLPLTIWGITCYMFGDLTTVLWGAFVPVVILWHSTWLVNSATHIWGYKRFQTNDDSKNNWWVALLTFGEGWHNNHHHDPISARHGKVWWEIDISWLMLSFVLKKVGLVWDVKE